MIRRLHLLDCLGHDPALLLPVIERKLYGRI